MDDAKMIYCLCCIDDDGEVTHYFSTPEKREAWAQKDERTHVFWDYILDDPDHHEKPLPKAH